MQGESFHSLRAWPVLQATLQATFKFLGAVMCAVFVVYCMLFIVGSVIKAVRAAFSFVCGIGVLAPSTRLARHKVIDFLSYTGSTT